VRHDFTCLGLKNGEMSRNFPLKTQKPPKDLIDPIRGYILKTFLIFSLMGHSRRLKINV
jgi:hypothetical protein